ncbi:hypothetical protein A9Q86_09950 [Flavobacteriales bacterium 33_180_T64]|nr:hypothetical protein A9Q86_09950 [Flavobacteriales bacterium 33_180_T64]
MKKLILFTIFIVLVFKVNAQEQIKRYYNNGQLKSIGSYDQSTSDYGIKIGEWKTYYENGQLKSIGSHKRLSAYNSKTEHGEWKFYYDNGQLSEISSYSFGRKKGKSKTYYKNGKLKESVSYKSNSAIGRTKKIGAYKLYFENGQLSQTGNYADDETWFSDVKTGEWKHYYKNGKIKSTETFSSGNLIGELKHDPDNDTDNKSSESGNIDKHEVITKNHPDYNTDKNDFKSVKIGNQIWMSKNLNVSNFRNGDPILHAKSKEAWDKAGENGTPAWCYYENEPNNGAILGKLYNWYAVNDERGLAPLGWYIPSDDEWTELTDNLGGKENAGIKMKSMIMWNDYKNKREKGLFEGLPGGIRLKGNFKNGGIKGKAAHWWSSTDTWYRSITYYAEYVVRSGWNKDTGISVRCLKE